MEEVRAAVAKAAERLPARMAEVCKPVADDREEMAEVTGKRMDECEVIHSLFFVLVVGFRRAECAGRNQSGRASAVCARRGRARHRCRNSKMRLDSFRRVRRVKLGP